MSKIIISSKGTQGDVTPEAIAARDAAAGSASEAASSESAAQGYASTASGAASAASQSADYATAAAKFSGDIFSLDVAVPYASGLNVNSTRFTVVRDGQVYAPAAPVPFTTGAWDAGQWRLIQGVTGADLASEAGAGMVGLPGGNNLSQVLSVRNAAENPGTWGIVLGKQGYAAETIGPGSVLIDAYGSSSPNRLPGTQTLRAIVGGYDNEIGAGSVGNNGGLACVIFGSHHSEIQGPATHATIVGGSYLKILDGDYNTISGGTLNTIDTPGGSRCTIAGGSDNSISGAVSRVTIGGGGANTASGSQATISGGFQNTASGQQASVLGGTANTASGIASSALGGANNLASGNYSSAFGAWASATNYGEYAQASGRFSAAGDAQTSVLTLRRTSVNAIPVALRPDGGTTYLVVPDNTTWAFSALVVARRTDVAGESAAYRVEGLAYRDSGAGTIAFIGTPTVTDLGEADASWNVTVTLNTTQGALEINGVGAIGKNIRWVARLEIAQVKT